jgi:hypothetical protein
VNLSWNDMTDWASAEGLSLAEDFPAALLAAILLKYAGRRFAVWKRRTTRSKDGASVVARVEDGHARWPGHAAANAYAQSVQPFTRLTSDAPKPTSGREADLVERGLPESLVRVGELDYPSLTSGCLADRIRNGYA